MVRSLLKINKWKCCVWASRNFEKPIKQTTTWKQSELLEHLFS